jgi:enoyl-CoA hydratase/carnithine racemase
LRSQLLSNTACAPGTPAIAAAPRASASSTHFGLGGRAEAFLLNPEPLPARTAREWGVVAEVVPNGKALSRARELAELYLKAPEVTRRNTRIHFIQPLKERIVREVGYGLSLEGASSADLVKSMRVKSESVAKGKVA